MKPTIKIKVVGYLNLTTHKFYKLKKDFLLSLEAVKLKKDKLFKAVFIKQIALSVKLEQAKQQAKKLKGFFKFSKVRVLQTQIKQLNILYPIWAQLSF